MAGDISANSIQGLASGLDTKSIIEKLVEAEKKKAEPIQKRMEVKKVELDTWKQVKAALEAVKTKSEELSKKSLWDGKLITSSNPEVVEAIATSGAKPGKHTLVVDKLALAHQIASQGFPEKDTQIGKGTVTITIGTGSPQKLTLDDTNNTLQGFGDAVKALNTDVEANIIKTGNKERPYQIVLTSKKTGKEGEIKVEVNLTGDKGIPIPTFDPYYNQPDRWKGISKGDEKGPKATGTGSSTAVPELIGTYEGEDNLDLTFTVANTGIVGVSETLRVRWEDNKGRYGYLDLGSFGYTPGEPIPVVDGMSLVMTDGEIIVAHLGPLHVAVAATHETGRPPVAGDDEDTLGLANALVAVVNLAESVQHELLDLRVQEIDARQEKTRNIPSRKRHENKPGRHRKGLCRRQDA